MSDPKLNAHGSEIVRSLFEENTNEVKTLGDIVDKHDGDAIILTGQNRGDRSADPGEEDFVEDMLHADSSDGWNSVNDMPVGDDTDDEPAIGETDITGTVAGIARGFGSHVPLDLGRDGFQITEIPEIIGAHSTRKENEELDDYDDDNDQNGKFDSGELDEDDESGSDEELDDSEVDRTLPPSRTEGH